VLTITVKEASKLSRIGINEIYHQIKNNPKFPYFKVGNKILIPRELFEKWVVGLAKCD